MLPYVPHVNSYIYMHYSRPIHIQDSALLRFVRVFANAVEFIFPRDCARGKNVIKSSTKG